MAKRKLSEEEKEERDRCTTIRSMLRRAWSRDPKRFECFKKARRATDGTGRNKWEYRCAICEQWFKHVSTKAKIKEGCSKMIVDHIIPMGSFLKREHLPVFADRLFYGMLQLLCFKCHNKKSKEERAAGAYKRKDIK